MGGRVWVSSGEIDDRSAVGQYGGGGIEASLEDEERGDSGGEEGVVR